MREINISDIGEIVDILSNVNILHTHTLLWKFVLVYTKYIGGQEN